MKKNPGLNRCAAKTTGNILLHNSRTVRDWLTHPGVTTLYIEPGSPWENGYVESFHSRLKDELFNEEIFKYLVGSEGIDRTVARPL